MKPYILSSNKKTQRVFKAWSWFPFGSPDFNLIRPQRASNLKKEIRLENKRARALLKQELKNSH